MERIMPLASLTWIRVILRTIGLNPTLSCRVQDQ